MNKPKRYDKGYKSIGRAEPVEKCVKSCFRLRTIFLKFTTDVAFWALQSGPLFITNKIEIILYKKGQLGKIWPSALQIYKLMLHE